MVNNLDNSVNKKSNKKPVVSNRGSQGTHIHNDKKKKNLLAVETVKRFPLTAQASRSEYGLQLSGDFRTGLKVRGKCLLGEVIKILNEPNLQILNRIPIHPYLIPSARLNRIATMFCNYVFKKLKVSYRTKRPMTSGGMVGVYFDDEIGGNSTDISGTTPSSFLLEAEILECDHGTLKPVYENFSVSHTGKPFRPSYRCVLNTGDLQDTIQTNLVVASESNESWGTILGVLELEYEVDFSYPISIELTNNPWSVPGFRITLPDGDTFTKNAPFRFTPVSAGVDWVNSEGIYYVTFSGTFADPPRLPDDATEYLLRNGNTAFMVVRKYALSATQTVAQLTFYPEYSSIAMERPLTILNKWVGSRDLMFCATKVVSLYGTSYRLPTLHQGVQRLEPIQEKGVVPSYQQEKVVTYDQTQTNYFR